MKKIDLSNVLDWFGHIRSCKNNSSGIPLDVIEKVNEVEYILIQKFFSYLEDKEENFKYHNSVNTIISSYPDIVNMENSLCVLKYFSKKERIFSADLILIFKYLDKYLDKIPKKEEEKALQYVAVVISKGRDSFNGFALDSLRRLNSNYSGLVVPENLLCHM